MDFITIAYDKDCIGTIMRIDTPDGKRIVRKSEDESLNLEYLKEFIGCTIKFECVSKDNPIVVDKEATDVLNLPLGKLTAVTIDEGLTKKEGRKVFKIEYDNIKLEIPKELETKPLKKQISPPSQKQSISDQFKNKAMFEAPNREFMEKGDLVLVLNAATQQPAGYARIEYVLPSKVIGMKVVGILQLAVPSVQLIPCEIPEDCIKIENNKPFGLQNAPFPLLLVYFPFLKTSSILRPSTPGDGMLKHGGKGGMKISPNQPPIGGLR